MASGDTLLIFTPLHNEPPASVFATLDLRNNHPVLDFDDATYEAAIFSAVLPRNYAGGGIIVYLHWAATSDTNAAHHCYWDAAFERITANDLDIDADSFEDEISVLTDHPNATCGKITTSHIHFTDAQIDGLLAGEGFRLRIQRDGDGDDMTGDAELLFVELKET